MREKNQKKKLSAVILCTFLFFICSIDWAYAAGEEKLFLIASINDEGEVGSAGIGIVIYDGDENFLVTSTDAVDGSAVRYIMENAVSEQSYELREVALQNEKEKLAWFTIGSDLPPRTECVGIEAPTVNQVVNALYYPEGGGSASFLVKLTDARQDGNYTFLDGIIVDESGNEVSNPSDVTSIFPMALINDRGNLVGFLLESGDILSYNSITADEFYGTNESEGGAGNRSGNESEDGTGNGSRNESGNGTENDLGNESDESGDGAGNESGNESDESGSEAGNESDESDNGAGNGSENEANGSGNGTDDGALDNSKSDSESGSGTGASSTGREIVKEEDDKLPIIILFGAAGVAFAVCFGIFAVRKKGGNGQSKIPPASSAQPEQRDNDGYTPTTPIQSEQRDNDGYTPTTPIQPEQRDNHGYSPTMPYMQPQPAQASIRCMEGLLTGKCYPIASRGFVIGRDPACDVCYPEDTKGVSRNHCRLYMNGSQLVIMDCGSKYGTLLIGYGKLEPQQPVPVKKGDTFYIGSKQNGFTIQ